MNGPQQSLWVPETSERQWPWVDLVKTPMPGPQDLLVDSELYRAAFHEQIGWYSSEPEEKSAFPFSDFFRLGRRMLAAFKLKAEFCVCYSMLVSF